MKEEKPHKALVDEYLKNLEKIEQEQIEQAKKDCLDTSEIDKPVGTPSVIQLLTNNHNLILHGAPGMGKTYLAKRIAAALGATLENGRCEMVQFHPSYDYTDFVEGLRPVAQDQDSNNLSIGFELKIGVFKKFCLKAEQSTKVSIAGDLLKDLREGYDNLISECFEGKKPELTTAPNGTVYIASEVSTRRNLLVGIRGTQGSNRTYTITFDNILRLVNGGILHFIKQEKSYKDIVSEIGLLMKGNPYAFYAVLYYLSQSITSEISSTYMATDKDNRGGDLKYVFIIDEINRGDLSKIFGELFFSIDPGYRGEKGRVKTQYHNMVQDSDEDDTFRDGFYVPENVYIIGTMNDIDRSVESMDFAMRRRFAWKEVKPVDRVGMLDTTIKEVAIKRMNNLNEEIEKTPGLGSAYQIGPAYFLKVKDYTENDKWEQLWTYHLEGLLREYLRGMGNEDNLLNKLKVAYNNEQ